jgi:hypothetical protein
MKFNQPTAVRRFFVYLPAQPCRMRFFAFIFSVYIFGLTLVPCVDRPDPDAGCKVVLTQTGNDQHANDIDQCSPFCSCECCVTLVIQQDSSVHFDTFFMPQEYHSTEYVSAFPSDYLNAIWQPPQRG